MARAAVRLGEPLAANVTAVTPGTPLSLTRLRWGGSLLEEAQLHAGRALLTVAPHTVAAAAAGAPGLGRGVHAGAGRGRSRRARSRPRRAAGGRRLARRREGRRHRWSRRRLGGGLRRDRGARRAARRCRRLLARGDDVGLAPAHRPGRADGEQDRAGDLHRVRRVGRDPAHRGLPRARSGSSPSTPTPRRRSCRSPTTRSSATCTRWCRRSRRSCGGGADEHATSG